MPSTLDIYKGLNKFNLLKKREKRRIDYGIKDFQNGIEGIIRDFVKL